MISADLSAGAGGRSLGAAQAGINVRLAVEAGPHRPVGFFSWSTEGALRNIEMRRLKTDP